MKLWDVNFSYLLQLLFLVVNEDYTLPSNTNFTLSEEPIPVTVILLDDEVAGEGLETITLTLIQVLGPEDDSFILEYNTTVIHLRDIDGKAIKMCST